MVIQDASYDGRLYDFGIFQDRPPDAESLHRSFRRRKSACCTVKKFVLFLSFFAVVAIVMILAVLYARNSNSFDHKSRHYAMYTNGKVHEKADKVKTFNKFSNQSSSQGLRKLASKNNEGSALNNVNNIPNVAEEIRNSRTILRKINPSTRKINPSTRSGRNYVESLPITKLKKARNLADILRQTESISQFKSYNSSFYLVDDELSKIEEDSLPENEKEFYDILRGIEISNIPANVREPIDILKKIKFNVSDNISIQFKGNNNKSKENYFESSTESSSSRDSFEEMKNRINYFTENGFGGNKSNFENINNKRNYNPPLFDYKIKEQGNPKSSNYFVFGSKNNQRDIFRNFNQRYMEGQNYTEKIRPAITNREKTSRVEVVKSYVSGNNFPKESNNKFSESVLEKNGNIVISYENFDSENIQTSHPMLKNSFEISDARKQTQNLPPNLNSENFKQTFQKPIERNESRNSTTTNLENKFSKSSHQSLQPFITDSEINSEISSENNSEINSKKKSKINSEIKSEINSDMNSEINSGKSSDSKILSQTNQQNSIQNPNVPRIDDHRFRNIKVNSDDTISENKMNERRTISENKVNERRTILENKMNERQTLSENKMNERQRTSSTYDVYGTKYAQLDQYRNAKYVKSVQDIMKYVTTNNPISQNVAKDPSSPVNITLEAKTTPKTVPHSNKDITNVSEKPKLGEPFSDKIVRIDLLKLKNFRPSHPSEINNLLTYSENSESVPRRFSNRMYRGSGHDDNYNNYLNLFSTKIPTDLPVYSLTPSYEKSNFFDISTSNRRKINKSNPVSLMVEIIPANAYKEISDFVEPEPSYFKDKYIDDAEDSFREKSWQPNPLSEPKSGFRMRVNLYPTPDDQVLS